MSLDLKQCRIIQPDTGRSNELYQFLGRIFEVDQPLFDRVLEGRMSLYGWQPYTLIYQEMIIANVSLMSFRIWLNGQVREVPGVASVATHEAFRRQGLAKYLIDHCLNTAEVKNRPIVLFTDLPAVYESFGFRVVDQGYRSLRAESLTDRPCREDIEAQVFTTIDDRTLDRMKKIYDEQYPHYDGKVVRDESYWQWYRHLFDVNGKCRIVLCRHRSQLIGYVRLEKESDRLLASEICCEAIAAPVIRSVLTFIGKTALKDGMDWVTLTLPEKHFVWELLEKEGVGLEPEAGARREIFMVRPAEDISEPELYRLRWSLADKF